MASRLMEGKCFHGTCVLIADEDRGACLMFRGILESLGFVVDVVHDGEAAVRASNESKYALIFMDAQMPVRSGAEAAKEILNSGCQTFQPKIVGTIMMISFKETG